MIKSVTITNSNGEQITINLGDVEPSTGLFISEIEGLGPVKANVSQTKLASNDGSKHNSVRAESRNIIMHVRFINASSIEDVRLLTYKYFPLKKKITFHIETDNRIAEVDGVIESNEPDIFSPQESATISIVCESSWFNDASDNRTQIDDFSNIVPTFEFEFSDEEDETPSIIFSEIELKRQNVVTYRGEVDSGFVMRIFIMGEVVNPIIYNLETRKSMKIDTSKIESIIGESIRSGDEIRISTISRNKSISLLREGTIYNILNALDKDVSWFAIHQGDNLFSYTAEVGELDMLFRMESPILFQGV